MKILYTANERRDAQLAATALRTITQDVTVDWAGRLYDARRWVYENQDLAALVVESEVQNQSCASFVGHLRSLGVTAPIVVVAPEKAGPPVDALKAGADDYVAKNESLLPNLTAVMRRTLRCAETTSEPLRVLYVGDATLARACLDGARCAIEITEVVPGVNGHFRPVVPESGTAGKTLPFDVLMVEHDHPEVNTFAILKEVVDHQLPVPVIFVVEWDEELAIPALRLGATDYVVKTKDAFRALIVRLDRRHRAQVLGTLSAPQTNATEAPENRQASIMDSATRERLERKILDAQAATRDIEWRVNVLNEDNKRLRESEARLQAAVESERTNREALEQKVTRADAALQRAEQLRASAAALFEQAAQQASESSSRLEQVVRSRDVLVEQLSQATQALERAKKERKAEATAAAEQLSRREAELAAARGDVDAARESLEREVEQRSAIARQLTTMETALHEAEQRHASEMTAAAQQLAQRDEAFTATLGQVIRSRDAVDQRLNDALLALERGPARSSTRCRSSSRTPRAT